ncbi:hypothetical protein IFM89_020133 [Coptis chinensis]|uniref:Uncharacterized protein n=1 Tax=Coptis chinensis TaxID=261450 RepID=A0A835M367_9MAGN|nr:hypothetical protein IFM89_020133 [Coptis chinensis]
MFILLGLLKLLEIGFIQIYYRKGLSLFGTFYGFDLPAPPYVCARVTQAVQEFGKCRPSLTASSFSGDEVLITKADLEGYHNISDATKKLNIVAKAVKVKPMIARLSCLFAALKVSGSNSPVASRLPQIRAC